MQPKKTRGKKEKAKRIHVQFRLHEGEVDELPAIEEAEWFLDGGYSEREMGRELLLLHREMRKHGYEPAKVRSPQVVTLDMQKQMSQIIELTNFIIGLLQSMQDGSFTPPAHVRDKINTTAERIGVDMSASHLAGAVINIEIDEDEEWG